MSDLLEVLDGRIDGSNPMSVAVECNPKPFTGANVTLPLRNRAVSASIWIVASQPIGIVLQTGRSMILTRLLLPEAFGLMSLVQVVLQGLIMCSDLGIEASIVRHRERLDERFLRTAWTVQIVRAVLLFIASCILAWPAAWFYGQPMLLALIPACGLNMVISSLRSTVTETMSRELEQGRLLRFNYAMSIAGTVAMVLIAYWTRSVWALVLGTMVEWVLYALFSHWMSGSVRHRFCWNREIVRQLTQFGRWIVVSTFLLFLAQQMDRLILGKLVSAQVLGVYGIAMVLAMKPRDLILSLSGSVLFPVLSEHFRDNPDRMSEKVLGARSMLLTVGLLSMAAAGLGARLFFEVLYDRRYWDAGWMAQLSLLAMWMGILQKSAGYVLLTLGDSRSLAISNAVQIVGSVGGVILGQHFFGLPGFIVGLGVGGMLSQIFTQLALRRQGIGIVWQDIAYTFGCAFSIGFGTLCLHEFATGSTWPDRAKSVAIIVLCMAPLVWFTLTKLPPGLDVRRASTT